MIWGARSENLDKKYFRKIQVFRQTQWAMLSWMWFSKRWKRKGLSKMLSDDFNQTEKRFSCWLKLHQTPSSPAVQVLAVQTLKVSKWSTSSWSVFLSMFVANSTSLLTISRFSWNKMVSNKSQRVKTNQSKTWSTKITLVSFKLWSTTSVSNKPQMVFIEQRILISQVLSKVSTRRVERSTCSMPHRPPLLAVHPTKSDS